MSLRHIANILGPIMEPDWILPPRVKIPVHILQSPVRIQFNHKLPLKEEEFMEGWGRISRFLHEAIVPDHKRDAFLRAGDAAMEIGLSIPGNINPDGFVDIPQKRYKDLTGSQSTYNKAVDVFKREADAFSDSNIIQWNNATGKAETPGYKADVMREFAQGVMIIGIVTESYISMARAGRSDFRDFLPE